MKKLLSLLLAAALLLSGCGAPVLPVSDATEAAVSSDSTSAAVVGSEHEPEPEPKYEPESAPDLNSAPVAESESAPTLEFIPVPDPEPAPESKSLGDWDWCWIPSDKAARGQWTAVEWFSSTEPGEWDWIYWNEAQNRMVFTSYIGPDNSQALRDYLTDQADFSPGDWIYNTNYCLRSDEKMYLLNDTLYKESPRRDKIICRQLSPTGDIVYDFFIIVDRIYYLTPTDLWSVAADGSNRRHVAAMPGEQVTRIAHYVNRDVLYLQTDNMLWCIYRPTGELICSWEIEGLAEWYPYSIHEIGYRFYREPAYYELFPDTIGSIGAWLVYDNRTGDIKVKAFTDHLDNGVAWRQWVTDQAPAWLQEMAALGYAWEDVYLPTNWPDDK